MQATYILTSTLAAPLAALYDASPMSARLSNFIVLFNHKNVYCILKLLNFIQY